MNSMNTMTCGTTGSTSARELGGSSIMASLGWPQHVLGGVPAVHAHAATTPDAVNAAATPAVRMAYAAAKTQPTADIRPAASAARFANVAKPARPPRGAPR